MFEAIIVIILTIIVIIALNRARGSNGLVSEQIKIDGLKDALTDLRNGKTEFDFIGITSDGVDCIYFMPNTHKFNLDFEAMGQDQVPYIKKIEDFAASNDLKSVMTTYGNKPNYDFDKPAPVIRIEANYSRDEITILAEKLLREVFWNNSATVYSIVP